jgi:S-adenosyl methyltransferase
VTQRPPTSPEPDWEPVDIDTSVPHPARIYDYLLGGKENFAVDREAAAQVAGAHPGGLETARAVVRANRAFLGRAVRYLATEAGIRQFLDIGTGVPTEGNTHEVAQQAAPDARVVYVDNDPIVLALSRSLLRSTPEGATAYVDGDLREPEAILERAAATLDLAQPVGIMLVAVLHLIPAADDPYGIVARLVDAVPAGSYLVVSCLAKDIHDREMAEASERHGKVVQEPIALWGRDDVARLFDGLEVAEPGVVQVHRWRRGADSETVGSVDAPATPIYGAVGRKM